MNKDKKQDLIRALWTRYGKKTQLMKAVEEMAELQKEIMKALALMEMGKDVPLEIIRNIAEEKEDVKFLMEQLDFMYVGPDDLRMNAKLDKLKSDMKPFINERKINFPNHSSFRSTYANIGTDENGKKFFEEGYIGHETEAKNEKIVRGKVVIKSMYEHYNTHDGLSRFLKDWENAFGRPDNTFTDHFFKTVEWPPIEEIYDSLGVPKCPVCFYYMEDDNHKCDLDNLSKY